MYLIGCGGLKRFIRYLYEYEQGRRTRNVGFVKVEQDEQECVVHVHGKGLRMGGQRRLGLYLFYENGGGCTGVWQGEIDNINPAVNYRLHYTRDDVGEPENFERINGVIMSNGDGRKYASVWNDMPVDVEHMQVWTMDQGTAGQEDGQAVAPRARQEMAEEMLQGRQEMAEEMPQTRQEEVQEMHEEAQPEKIQGMMPKEEGLQMCPESEPEEVQEMTVEPQGEGLQEMMTQLRPEEAEQEAPAESAAEEAEGMPPGPVHTQEAGRSVKPWKVTKIQRKELAKLPRCEWRLANNNFLLHGYYNYRHLVFIENDRTMYLGVPGNYHEKEAEAAGAWGFPDFVPLKELEVSLASEEWEEEGQFGYWCRQVRHPFC